MVEEETGRLHLEGPNLNVARRTGVVTGVGSQLGRGVAPTKGSPDVAVEAVVEAVAAGPVTR